MFHLVDANDNLVMIRKDRAKATEPGKKGSQSVLFNPPSSSSNPSQSLSEQGAQAPAPVIALGPRSPCPCPACIPSAGVVAGAWDRYEVHGKGAVCVCVCG